jgi:hypothetical protein
MCPPFGLHCSRLHWSSEALNLLDGCGVGRLLHAWWLRADGSSVPEKLISEKTPIHPWSISPDERHLAFVRNGGEQNFEIWTLPLDLTDPDHAKPGERQPFLREPAGQVDPMFSPDGTWTAYASAKSGAHQVVVRPFPSTPSAPRWQITAGDGRFPMWSRNSRELFYLDRGGCVAKSLRGFW